MNLPRIHRYSARFIGLFLLIHMANHVVIFWGFDAHRTFMDSARLFYRHPMAEALLFVALVLQLGSGVRLALTRQGPAPLRRWQAASGACLGIFLLVHTTAVMVGRWQNQETDIYFAAAGLHQGAAWFFVPYYGLAMVALSVHLGCAVAPRWAMAIGVVGSLFGLLLVTTMAGGFFEVIYPPAHASAVQR